MTTSLSTINGIRPPEAIYEKDEQFVLPGDYIGLEIELENIVRSDPELPKRWSTHEDHSLRNHGREYVLLQPYFGKDLSAAVYDLHEYLKKRHPNASINERTGMHIHLDMRDSDTNVIRNLLLLAVIFERLLFKYSGLGREESIFCIPFHKHGWHMDAYHALSQPRDKIRRYLESYNRYSSINLNSLLIHGSMEFRHMPSSYEPEELIKWINVIQSLKKYAVHIKQYTGSALLDYIRSIPYSDFVTEVFRNKNVDLSDELNRLPLKICIGRGLRDANDMVLHSLAASSKRNMETSSSKGNSLATKLYFKEEEKLKKEEQKRAEKKGAKKKAKRPPTPFDSLVEEAATSDTPAVEPVHNPSHVPGLAVPVDRPTMTYLTSDREGLHYEVPVTRVELEIVVRHLGTHARLEDVVRYLNAHREAQMDRTLAEMREQHSRLHTQAGATDTTSNVGRIINIRRTRGE